jgi:hypothetical protein
VLVVLVPGVPFERLLGDPDIRALAASGGAGLMPATQDPRATLQAAFPAVEIYPLPTSTYDLRLTLLEQGLGPVPAPLSDLGRVVRETTRQFDVGELMVLIVGERPSGGMRAAKDELLPVILAVGPPASLFSSDAPPGSLTSDSTRRAGVVAVPDLSSTILSFAGAPIPGNPRAAADTGSAIRVLGEPAPFLLHERYLAQRRMYVPVGEAAALYLVLVGLLGVAFVALGRQVPGGARRVVGWGCLSVSALATGMLAAGHLPELTYATVVPFIAIVTAFGTLAFSPLEGRSLTLVPAGIGVAVLVYFAVEALLGWSGALATFLGGTHLDGGRFYGLPNVFIGLLAGAGLYVAQRLRTSAGFALLLVIALVAGLPFAGANLGGAVTLFAAAGLWVAVRERERLGPWRGLGVLALTVVAGTALILLAHRAWPVPTHITRFEENAGGPAGIWGTFVHRLGVGIDLIRRNPAALVPVLGMPVALLAVLRPPASIRATFERWPAWRDAVLVTLLTGIVAYLANDSGPAAAGLAFGLGLGGMLGVSLLATAGKMEGS